MEDFKMDIEKIMNDINMNWIWSENSQIIVKYQKNSHDIVIEANKDGLISLAKLLLRAAYEEWPKGHHLHLDAMRKNWNGQLGETSDDVIIYKK